MLKFPWGIQKEMFSEQLNIQLREKVKAEYRDLSDIHIQVVLETLPEVSRKLYRVRKTVTKDRAGEH